MAAERVQLIEAEWFFNFARLPPAPPFLATVCNVPFAVPTRMGWVEPLPRLVRDAYEELVSFWPDDTDELLLWSGRLPFAGGSLTTKRWARHSALCALDLSWIMSPEVSPNDLRRLFLEIARTNRAVYGTVQVKCDYLRSGRSVFSDERTECPPFLPMSPWLGLLPQPVWLSWLGPQYRSTANHHEWRGVEVADEGAGLVVQASDDPLTSAQYYEQFHAGLHRSRWQVGDWLSPDLLCTVKSYRKNEILRFPLGRALTVPDVESD